LMRQHLQSELSQEAHDILTAAESSTDNFESFFAGFARVGVKLD